ncbi:MAG TPA: hypothetical protein VM689_08200 [Aliidongia sp.]|nr:hypothetical protein [Aliidongia sp.]
MTVGHLTTKTIPISRRVEYVCTIGEQPYAFEHTGIEPFESFIKMLGKLQRLADVMESRFSERSDAELCELVLPVGAALDLSGKGIARVRQASA